MDDLGGGGGGGDDGGGGMFSLEIPLVYLLRFSTDYD